MPRRNFRRSQQRKVNNNANQVTISGVDLVNLSYSASFSFAQFYVKPSGLSRAVTLRDCFELYRFDYLEVRSLPSSTGPVSMGYLGGETGGTFTSWNNILVANLSPSAVWYPGQTTPIKFVVPKRKIGMQLLWNLTTDANNASGSILVGGIASTAVSVYVQIKWTITFKGPVYQGKETVPAVFHGYSGGDEKVREPETSEEQDDVEVVYSNVSLVPVPHVPSQQKAVLIQAAVTPPRDASLPKSRGK